VGLAGCFSLQSSNSVASGEGGLLVTDDDEVYRRAVPARHRQHLGGLRAAWSREPATDAAELSP
jgi:dTDP-4-amino-4,6-dideoxygalactose transaminase